MAEGNDLPGADGENQDVCSFFASFINQRQSVERLLNWLRESQTACTDTNCFDDVNGFPGTEQGSPLLENESYGDNYNSETDTLALVLWSLVGLLTVYAMFLSRDRETGLGGNKYHNGSNGGDDDDHGRHRRNYGDGGDQNRPAL